ncbi:hypothetical protein SAMN05720473_102153 [Fibrobacter sp. UWB15]|uniref:hypothetical protein n=1 Tax=unclassified Fibrobacter TaxID=2634177 RepID=UPI00091310FD|nr:MULTISPECIES: hypothetical protein [unclassified Fibrobacter]PWJ66418.1 hypothetical protein BGW99_102153 [Fibrobacter sp. UWB6]SHG04280.1 hypothetical protein SAMN05720760_103139 [Fibrobacter sp. UWB8]SMG21414.1 hypothetical protein SAMN05720473_102153 [Fibrobacter sp. UWB15]
MRTEESVVLFDGTMNYEDRSRGLEKKLLFLFGFLGTMPIIQIGGFTIFTFLLFSVVLFKLLVTRKIRVRSVCVPYVLIVICSVCTVVSCLTSNIPEWWKNAQWTELLWDFFYLFLFLAYTGQQNSSLIINYMRGVFVAAVFQMAWGYFQFVSYYLAHIDINNIIFVNILNMVPNASQIMEENLKISGMCWNSGNFAPLMLLGYCLSEKMWMKLLFAGMCCMSGSRTLFLGFVAVAACEFIRTVYNDFFRSRVRIRRKMVLFAVAILAVIFVGAHNQIVVGKVLGVRDSLTSNVLDSESSARLHARYWTSIPLITKNNSLEKNLLGFGLKSSGYSQVLYYGQYADSKYAWVVECDFINNLWSRGYLGFILLYSWLFYHFIKGAKMNYRYGLFFLGLLVEGVTYNVMFNWCWVFLLFCILYKDGLQSLPCLDYSKKK